MQEVNNFHEQCHDLSTLTDILLKSLTVTQESVENSEDSPRIRACLQGQTRGLSEAPPLIFDILAQGLYSSLLPHFHLSVPFGALLAGVSCLLAAYSVQ